MDGPAWRDHGLLVVDNQVMGFIRHAHQMEDPVVSLDVEKETSFHVSGVSVSEHRVAQIVLFQQSHPRDELATLRAVGVDEFVDGPLAGIGNAPPGEAARYY